MKPHPGNIPLLSLPIGSAEFPAHMKTIFRRPIWLITIELTIQESLANERMRKEKYKATIIELFTSMNYYLSHNSHHNQPPTNSHPVSS